MGWGQTRTTLRVAKISRTCGVYKIENDHSYTRKQKDCKSYYANNNCKFSTNKNEGSNFLFNDN